MFHTHRYSGESLIKIIELLHGRSILDFLKTHKEAMLQIKSIDEASRCILMVLDNLNSEIQFSRDQDSIKKYAEETLHFLLSCFKQLFLSGFKFQDFRNLLFQIHEKKLLSHFPISAQAYLSDDLIRFMQHTIYNADELAEILSLVCRKDIPDTINNQDAYWARQERRIAFLSGSVRKDASNHFLFSQDKEFKLRKKILQFAELDYVDSNKIFLKK
jgi:hypothetical protein